LYVYKIYDEISGRFKIRGQFLYNEHEYDLTITDVKAEEFFLMKDTKCRIKYRIKNLYLCIILGEPLEDYCYKLLAGLIVNPKDLPLF